MKSFNTIHAVVHETMLLRILTALFILGQSGHAISGEKTYTVMGESMAPALQRGDRVVIDDAAAEPLSKGDLVALQFRHSETPIVKRIIAMEGDRLEIKNGTLILNGKTVRNIDANRWRSTIRQLERYGWVVPENKIFVLGDNPKNSRDSRRLGLIPLSRIAGKVVKIIRSGP